VRHTVTTLEHGQVMSSEILAVLPLLDSDNTHWCVEALLTHGHRVRLLGLYETHKQAADMCVTLIDDLLRDRWVAKRTSDI
jgi:hypothetical protein